MGPFLCRLLIAENRSAIYAARLSLMSHAHFVGPILLDLRQYIANRRCLDEMLTSVVLLILFAGIPNMLVA